MTTFFVGLIIFLIIIAVVGVFLRKQQPKSAYRKTRERLISFGFTNAALGLLLLFFTSELIPFLSSRFWFLLWLIEMLAWLFFITRELKEIPKIREKIAEEKKLKQYIP